MLENRSEHQQDLSPGVTCCFHVFVCAMPQTHGALQNPLLCSCTPPEANNPKPYPKSQERDPKSHNNSLQKTSQKPQIGYFSLDFLWLESGAIATATVKFSMLQQSRLPPSAGGVQGHGVHSAKTAGVQHVAGFDAERWRGSGTCNELAFRCVDRV